MFDLGVGKYSERDSPKHKYKGRVVFGGHRIHDEYGLAAEFDGQGSGTSSLTASNFCDTVSMLPGCSGEQCDAPSAYTRSKLGTGMKGHEVVTLVELPPSQWPDSWKKAGMKMACCILRLSLYGGPLNGKYSGNTSHQHFSASASSTWPAGSACMSIVTCS